jgi:ferredoxin/coenzyme F420-reducing hydrogenase delta subunit
VGGTGRRDAAVDRPAFPAAEAQGAAAVVDLDNCNGCGRCVADCPYSAVSLRPRTDGASYSHEAVVTNEKCVSCGICVGACPTSTPFRRRAELVPGIDLPGLAMAALRDSLVESAGNLNDHPRVLVIGCGAGVSLDSLAGPGVATKNLPCVGQLPPSFIDFLITRGHFEGVFLTGCRNGDCEYRLGQRWTEARLGQERDPHLRSRVPRERIHTFWAGRDGAAAAGRELARFRASLREHDGGTPDAKGDGHAPREAIRAGAAGHG